MRGRAVPCGVRRGIPPRGRRRSDQADRASPAARQVAEPALGAVLRGGADTLVLHYEQMGEYVGHARKGKDAAGAHLSPL